MNVWLGFVMGQVVVDLGVCIRCAACSTVAPRTFEVTPKGTRVIRQPVDDVEATAARVAALICPTKAIRP